MWDMLVWAFGMALLALPFLIIAQLLYMIWMGRRRKTLLKAEAPDAPLVFLDARLGVAPTIAGRAVPEGYRLATLFFGAGLIDRTKTLDQGFDYEVLDPIPAPGRVADMPTLLKRRATELRRRADRTGEPVRLFWSGGIDSTAAACALLEAFIDAPRRLEIVYTSGSIHEYRLFHKHYVARHPGARRVKNLREAMGDKAILCTGEHGDQLFGSMKAMKLNWRDLQAPWEEAMPRILTRQLRTAARAETTLRYLEPQIAACPIALPRLFDLLWWLNFSLKWQSVSLRLFADGTPQSWALRDKAEHFFRTEDFQLWALANPDKRIKNDWRSYKFPLKEEILRFTGDQRYFDRKQKVPSLRGRMGARSASIKGLALGVTASGAYLHQAFDNSLRSDDGLWLTIEFSSEGALWRDLDDGE